MFSTVCMNRTLVLSEEPGELDLSILSGIVLAMMLSLLTHMGLFNGAWDLGGFCGVLEDVLCSVTLSLSLSLSVSALLCSALPRSTLLCPMRRRKEELLCSALHAHPVPTPLLLRRRRPRTLLRRLWRRGKVDEMKRL